jgi:autotransporter-associated beta strand protein
MKKAPVFQKIPAWIGALVAACLFPGFPFWVFSASAAPPPGYYLVWQDEFNSTSLDSSKWEYWLLGRRRDAFNVTNAVSLNGSNLVITTYTSNHIHYTGMVASRNKFRSRFGYWESSLRWGDTNGMWSAFWMQSPEMITRFPDPRVSGSEIDIAEHRRLDKTATNIANQIQVNIHWDGYGRSSHSSSSGNVASNLADGFHTYGFLWTPDSYSFLVDGSKVYNGGRTPICHSTEWVIFSSEVDDTSTLWAQHIPPDGYGSLTDSSTKLAVDYVRYYAPSNVLFWTGANSAYWTNSDNWVSGLTPTTNSDLTFGDLSRALEASPGGDCTVAGLVFLPSTGKISIGGNNTLTVGSDGIDMLVGNHPVTIDAPISLAGSQTWLIGRSAGSLELHAPLSGTNTLTKSGPGTLILYVTNTFAGRLNIDEGTLRVNGLLAANSLLLSSNSTLVIEIDQSQIQSDRLQLSSELHLSGNLVVTNILGDLSEGDSLKLFHADHISGSFDHVTLPALSQGLDWNIANLTNGSLSVIRVAQSKP